MRGCGGHVTFFDKLRKLKGQQNAKRHSHLHGENTVPVGLAAKLILAAANFGDGTRSIFDFDRDGSRGRIITTVRGAAEGLAHQRLVTVAQLPQRHVGGHARVRAGLNHGINGLITEASLPFGVEVLVGFQPLGGVRVVDIHGDIKAVLTQRILSGDMAISLP